MANAIDGIGTINVAQLVNSLMSVEGGQQKLLQTKQSKEQTALSALQTLNTQTLAIRTAAESIVGSVISPTAWNNTTATSSSSTVAATSVATAQTGDLSFDVLQTAATHRVLVGAGVPSGQTLTNGTVTFTAADGSVSSVDLSGASTITDVVATINGAGISGFSAIAVQVSPGVFRLGLNATKSGADGAFTVSGLEGSLGATTVVSTGQDAKIKIGPNDADVVTSATNTFSDVMPGLTFSVSKPETGVVVSVGRNTAGMTTQVQSIVDAMNTALSGMKAQTAYNATTKTGGPLLGDLLPVRLAGELSTATLGGSTMAKYGIQLDRTGKLVFDSATFQSSLASDPAGTSKAIADFATRVGKVARDATQYGTGWITSAITNRQNRITELGKTISDWDTRLANQRAALTTQFASLNAQLTTMNNQAAWLSSQLASTSSRSSTGSGVSTSNTASSSG
ncbi:MAG: flagellar filament capping protein FliD [Candidatus Nanopelagicales bacterium]